MKEEEKKEETEEESADEVPFSYILTLSASLSSRTWDSLSLTEWPRPTHHSLCTDGRVSVKRLLLLCHASHSRRDTQTTPSPSRNASRWQFTSGTVGE